MAMYLEKREITVKGRGKYNEFYFYGKELAFDDKNAATYIEMAGHKFTKYASSTDESNIYIVLEYVDRVQKIETMSSASALLDKNELIKERSKQTIQSYRDMATKSLQFLNFLMWKKNPTPRDPNKPDDEYINGERSGISLAVAYPLCIEATMALLPIYKKGIELRFPTNLANAIVKSDYEDKLDKLNKEKKLTIQATAKK